jgi:hypothetical protein
MQRILIALTCAAVAMSLVGCGSAAKTYDISVELQPEVRVAGTTNVHLIGLNEARKVALENSPSSYWDRRPQDRSRDYPNVHEMRFESEVEVEQTLKRSESAWTNWRHENATWVAVLTEGAGTNQMKKFISLTEDWGGRRLRVIIGRSDITIRADDPAP